MKTIDWPDDMTQSYVNIDLPRRIIMLDDDHQAVGKHSAELGVDGARQLAASHHAMGEALDAAADLLEGAPKGEAGPNAAAPPVA